MLDWFARLWELEKDEYWGYITNCGTEGNLHGILVGLVFILGATMCSVVFDALFSDPVGTSLWTLDYGARMLRVLQVCMFIMAP